jgi:PAS domain S-box-containing protein
MGLVAFLGWATGIDLLQSLRPAWVPMKPNTALCLFLAGTSLWLQHRGQRKKPALICAGLVLVIAVATFAEHFFGVSFGLDELLLSDPTATGDLPPGRMSPHTSLGLTAIALALLLLPRARGERRQPLSLWLAGLVVSVAAAMLFALAFQGAAETQPILMSGPVAAALLVLSIGTLFARPEDHLVRMLFANNSSGMLLRRLFLGVMIVPAVLGRVFIALLSHEVSMSDGVLLLAVVTMLSTFVLTLVSAENAANEAHWRESADEERLRLTAELQRQAGHLQETVALRTQELREANTSLQSAVASNARLALVANHTTNGVAIIDATGRIEWVNAAFERITGYTPGEIKGWKLTQFLQGPDSEQAGLAQLHLAIQQGDPCNVEVLTYTRQGQPYWQLVNVEPVRDRSGRVANFISIQTDVTEQRRVRERLQILNQRLELATRAADLGVWEWNASTERFNWDERMLAIHGISSTAFSGRMEEWSRDLHPDDRQRALDAFKDVLAGSDEYDQSFRIIRPADGTMRYLEARGVVQRDEEGRLRRITGTCRDITSEKQVLDALKVAEERWQLAIEGTNDAVWDWNIQAGLVFHDVRWSRMLGFEFTEIDPTLDGWRELVHPDDLPANERAIEEHFAQRTPFYQHEVRMRAKSGEWKWILDRGKVVMRDTDGRPLRMAGTHTDITDRKRLEQRLRQAEQLNLQVSQLAHIGGWELDLDTNRLAWSDIVNRIFELPANGQPSLDTALGFFLPEARASLEMAIQEAASKAQPFDLELPLTTAQGRQVWVRVLGTIEQRDGRPVRIQGAIQDVSARHDSDAAKRQLEAQLFQAQKMETLGTLAGGIAHDFNNLLTGIIGYHELAADSVPADHPAREYLAHSHGASLRARELVAQILTFGRQSPETEQEALDLALVIEEARRFLRSTLPASITIELQLDPHSPRVLGDATQVHQVLLNLGSNAAHAMRGSHGGVIKIALQPVTFDVEQAPARGGLPAGTYACLSVSDNGHGMNEETMRRIFDPFFTTKNTGEGTGLGLAVVHGIVRAHRGTIEVESKLGVGSTFRVYLPATASETPEIAPPLAAVPSATTNLAGNKPFICIVDDEELVGTCTKHALDGKGFESITYISAEDCLTALKANVRRFDLLITDQTMPGMQGTELAMEARKLFPALPVLIMSGYFSKIPTQALEELGSVELLAKPFTADELARAVQKTLHPIQAKPDA